MVTEGVVPHGFVACPDCSTPRKPASLQRCAQCPDDKSRRCAECAKKHRRALHRVAVPACLCCGGELAVADYAEAPLTDRGNLMLAAWRCSRCSCVYTFEPVWKRSVACGVVR